MPRRIPRHVATVSPKVPYAALALPKAGRCCHCETLLPTGTRAWLATRGGGRARLDTRVICNPCYAAGKR